MKLLTISSLLTAFVAMLFMASCKGDAGDEITYTVSTGDFKNVLKVDGVVESLQSINIPCPQGIDGLIAYLIDDGTWVEEGDTICVIDDMTVRTSYEEVKTRLEELDVTLVKTIATNNMEMALLEAQFEINEADTRIAQLDSLQLLYMAPGQRRIQELQLHKVALEKRGFDERMRALPIIQKADIQRIEREISVTKERKKEIEARMASLTVLAPKKGMVLRSWSPYLGEKLKVGDNIWGRYIIATMPDMEDFKVKIHVKETDFKHINLGDSVVYRFHAMPGELAYGKITNKVMAGVPVSRGSKIKLFEVEASVDSMTMKPDPGFSVECTIMLQEQKDVIFVPQVTIFPDDSIKVVYVKTESGYEKRQVETGLSSQTEVIITAGLAEGEKIAFLPPKESRIKRTTLLETEQEESSDPEDEANAGEDGVEEPADVEGAAPLTDGEVPAED